MKENPGQDGKILVLDENSTFALSLTNSLSGKGFEADAIYDGTTALTKMLENGYDLLIHCINPSDPDCYKVCKEIKKETNQETIPVILISDPENEEEICARGLEFGVLDCLKKPLDSSELTFKIASCLRIARTETELRQVKSQLKAIVGSLDRGIPESASRDLIESEERFRTIFVNTPDIVLIVRFDDLTIIDLNDRFLEMTKLERAAVIRKKGILNTFFVNQSELTNIHDLLRHNSVISNINVSLITPDGHIYPALVSCSKILLRGKTHVVVIVRSIEEIRQFQESLQKSETKYRLLADYNHNWEFWLGTDGKYVYISPSCELISGYKPHEFDDYPDLMLRLIHPEFREIYADHFNNAHKSTDPEVTIEFLIIDRYGNKKWISHNCSAVFDETGKFAGRRGNNSDITQKKLSELELHKLSTAIEQSNSGIVITDINGDIEYVNPYFEQLTGYTYKEVLGKNPRFLKSGKTDPRVHEELWSSISSGRIWEGEFINKRKNNELFIENAVITPVKDKNSRIVNYIAIKQDVTRQKEIDRKILHTIISTEEKERSRFAQDLHDDLGPLLSTAKLYIKSLETAKDQKSRQIAISKSIEAIDESLLSIKEIAYDLSPHILRNFGLISGINSLINKINDTGKIGIIFNSGIEGRFNENVESSVFRVISELISNTINHAQADRIEIGIKKNENELILTYSDNGIGFNLEKALKKKLSNGLSNIINRIKSLGGEIVFFGNCGAKVSIIIPLDR